MNGVLIPPAGPTDKAPDQIYFETIPKTSTGKIQKNVLRDRARDRVSDQAQPGAGTAGER
jgi:acyl-coenzyme A synthetase/AMP-(fatty) acid ligase